MKKYTLPVLALFLACGSLPTLANERRPAPPSFEELDTNGDGVLTKDELRGPLLDDFEKFDKDGSGSLSEDELPEPPKGRK
ncbi:hypothetical protein ACQKPX_10235 [Photobacterium sp. DNB23_23_1]